MKRAWKGQRSAQGELPAGEDSRAPWKPRAQGSLLRSCPAERHSANSLHEGLAVGIGHGHRGAQAGLRGAPEAVSCGAAPSVVRAEEESGAVEASQGASCLLLNVPLCVLFLLSIR